MRNNKGYNLICKFRHSLRTFSNSAYFGGLSNICHCIFVLLATAAIIFTAAETGIALNSNDNLENAGPVVNATDVFFYGTGLINFNANELPMFYNDLDEANFDPENNQGEFLTIQLSDEDEIAAHGLIYTSRAWIDENGRINIAWLGEKYLAVGDDTEKLTKYLVDFNPDENLTLELGEVWDIGEGFTLEFKDIDINYDLVWLVLEKDGSPIADIIAHEGEYGYYIDTVAGESDVVIAKIHVDTIFEDINEIIIDDVQIISLDVTELDETEYYGMDFDSGDYWLKLTEDDTTSISRGSTVEIIPDFLSIRVLDAQSYEPVLFYVFREGMPASASVSIVTDKMKYSAGENMDVILNIDNPTEGEVIFDWYIGIPQLNFWVPYIHAPIPPGFSDTYTIPIPVGNWGPSPIGLAHYVHMLDTGTGEVLAQDSATFAYSPSGAIVANSQVDIVKEIKKTKKKVELPI